MAKRLLLERKQTTPTETEGFLSFPGTILATIEKPWVEDGLGGKPYESCVPSGIYRLIPHTRPDGKEVLALINEDLGVYYLEEELPEEGGRFLILFHIANWAKDVVGCVGPGVGKTQSAIGPMVTSSKKAMKKIMDYVDGDDAELEIREILGDIKVCLCP